MSSTVLLKDGKSDGITVYFPKGDYFEEDGSQN
jgi:hypothetical protein